MGFVDIRTASRSGSRARRRRYFPLAALYAALDAERQSRGLTWSAAVREMGGSADRKTAHALSVSTVKRTRSSKVAEGDGVLQMLRWLGRAPESFIEGLDSGQSVALPDPGKGHVLRFDTKRLHGALNAERSARGLTWREIARETGTSESMLSHLSKGGRTCFPHVMRMTQWLGQPVARFTRVANH